MTYDLQNRCRFCMHQREILISLFDIDDSLPERIMIVFPKIKVTEADDLPNKICNFCLGRVNLCFKFQLQCELIDSALHEYVKNKDVQYLQKFIEELKHIMSIDRACELMKERLKWIKPIRTADSSTWTGERDDEAEDAYWHANEPVELLLQTNMQENSKKFHSHMQEPEFCIDSDSVCYAAHIEHKNTADMKGGCRNNIALSPQGNAVKDNLFKVDAMVFESEKGGNLSNSNDADYVSSDFSSEETNEIKACKRSLEYDSRKNTSKKMRTAYAAKTYHNRKKHIQATETEGCTEMNDKELSFTEPKEAQIELKMVATEGSTERETTMEEPTKIESCSDNLLVGAVSSELSVEEVLLGQESPSIGKVEDTTLTETEMERNIQMLELEKFPSYIGFETEIPAIESTNSEPEQAHNLLTYAVPFDLSIDQILPAKGPASSETIKSTLMTETEMQRNTQNLEVEMPSSCLPFGDEALPIAATARETAMPAMEEPTNKEPSQDCNLLIGVISYDFSKKEILPGKGLASSEGIENKLMIETEMLENIQNLEAKISVPTEQREKQVLERDKLADAIEQEMKEVTSTEPDEMQGALASKFSQTGIRESEILESVEQPNSGSTDTTEALPLKYAELNKAQLITVKSSYDEQNDWEILSLNWSAEARRKRRSLRVRNIRQAKKAMLKNRQMPAKEYCTSDETRTVQAVALRQTAVRKELTTEQTTDVSAVETDLFCCEPCKYQFDYGHELDEHIQECHKKMKLHVRYVKEGANNNKFILHASAERRRSCPHCNLEFLDDVSLKAHLVSHGVKPYQCTLCGRGFSQEELLCQHKCRFSSEAVQCDTCKEELPSRSVLTMHILEKHPREDFKCSLCFQSFVFESELMKHINLAHSNSSKCHLCERLIEDKTELEVHMQKHSIGHHDKIINEPLPFTSENSY